MGSNEESNPFSPREQNTISDDKDKDAEERDNS